MRRRGFVKRRHLPPSAPIPAPTCERLYSAARALQVSCTHLATHAHPRVFSLTPIANDVSAAIKLAWRCRRDFICPDVQRGFYGIRPIRLGEKIVMKRKAWISNAIALVVTAALLPAADSLASATQVGDFALIDHLGAQQ